MFMFDAKRDLSTIMAKRKKGDEEYGPSKMKNESVKTEDGEVDGRHLAAQDALSAIKEGSPQKLMDSWIAFHDIHQAMRANEEQMADENEPDEALEDDRD